MRCGAADRWLPTREWPPAQKWVAEVPPSAPEGPGREERPALHQRPDWAREQPGLAAGEAWLLEEAVLEVLTTEEGAALRSWLRTDLARLSEAAQAGRMKGPCGAPKLAELGA